MKRLFCQAMSTLFIYSLYHCATFFASHHNRMSKFLFRFSTELSSKGMHGKIVCIPERFAVATTISAIVHRVLGLYYLLHCYYYGLISFCSSRNIETHTHRKR